MSTDRAPAPRSTMTSVDRALSLLHHFSAHRPELGLSELARLSGFDKTTTLRCLTALERNGLLEQHPETRKYRVGVAPLHLSRIREQSFPVHALLQPALDRIVEEVQETAHASLLSHGRLLTVAVAEPSRSTRVVMDIVGPLPLHATASGLAVLAAGGADDPAPGTLAPFTDRTPTDPARVAALVAQARDTGVARAEGLYEDDVTGSAVALRSGAGTVIGALAVATVSSRFDADLARRIDTALLRASADLGTQLGTAPHHPHRIPA